MKLNIEPFLFDNALMNGCVFLLTAAWLGVRIRPLPTVLLSLLGAVYALLSLFVFPILREPYWKLPAFLLGALPLFRRAGPWHRTLPFLLLSAATVGGSAMLLTLLFGGSIAADGTVLGTVPLRAALVSAALALSLPRILRAMLKSGTRKAPRTEAVIVLKSQTYRVTALIDSGNLLTEPISGLPVVLVGFPLDAPTRPIPYRKATGTGILYGERVQRLLLPAYGEMMLDCFCATAPEPLKGVQAIVPEALLPQEWRTKHDPMDATTVGSPRRLAARWQKRYLLVHSQQRNAAAAARAG